MIMTDEQLNLASKHLGVAKQKLSESAHYIDPKSDRYKFNDEEADRLQDLLEALDGELSDRRKQAAE